MILIKSQDKSCARARKISVIVGAVHFLMSLLPALLLFFLLSQFLLVLLLFLIFMIYIYIYMYGGRHACCMRISIIVSWKATQLINFLFSLLPSLISGNLCNFSPYIYRNGIDRRIQLEHRSLEQIEVVELQDSIIITFLFAQ